MAELLDRPVAITADRQEAARSFLQSVFEAPSQARFLDPEVFAWKYQTRRTDCAWLEHRNFGLFEGDRIKAHCGIWPLAVRGSKGERFTALHLIDWGADVRFPGAGTLLYMRLARMAQCAIVIGGAPQARKILPKIGFQLRGEMRTFQFVTKPWEHYRRAQPDSAAPAWRRPARLVRDGMRLLHPGRWRRPAGLSAEPVSSFRAGWSPAGASDPGGWLQFDRNPGFLNYIRDCPGMTWQAYLLHRGSHTAGHLLINTVGNQARVADLWIPGRDQHSWKDATALALDLAAARPGACQVLASAASPFLWSVFESLGFRILATRPVFVADPGKCLASSGPQDLHLTMIDSDAFLLP